MLEIARIVATRSTCLRRAVGCVLMDTSGRIVATGYNGVAHGQPHCNEDLLSGEASTAVPEYLHACAGAMSPSGQDLDLCEAIHAEANALVWCREPDKLEAAYVTTPPCVSCVKLLLGTQCQRLVVTGDYPHAVLSKSLWVKGGREWVEL